MPMIYLGRVDAALGYSGLVTLVLDLVQQGADLVELSVTGCRAALLDKIRWRRRFRQLGLSSRNHHLFKSCPLSMCMFTCRIGQFSQLMVTPIPCDRCLSYACPQPDGAIQVYTELPDHKTT